MNRNSQKWQMALVVAAVAVAVGVTAEAILRPQKAPGAPAAPPTPPQGALDPPAAAYRPTGAAWTEYLKRRPLKVGDRAPVLNLEDQRGPGTTPHKGKPAMWAVLCGCNDCADAGYQLFQIMMEMGKDQVDAVIFVPNTTDYVQERMHQSFGGRCRVIDDRLGEYYRQLRPAGNSYSRLPMVWGIDRNGRVVFFDRTHKGKSEWASVLKKKLGLKVPLEPVVD